MAQARLQSLVRHLHRLTGESETVPSDRRLLERFVRGQVERPRKLCFGGGTYRRWSVPGWTPGLSSRYNAAIGIGGNLIPKEAIEHRQAGWIAELARRFKEIVAETREQLAQ